MRRPFVSETVQETAAVLLEKHGFSDFFRDYQLRMLNLRAHGIA
jgi:hypothetical protein